MVSQWVRVLGEYQASAFNIIKVHATQHLPDDIWQAGAPREFSSNPFEHLHIDLLKIGYRASNHRDAMPQVLLNHRRRKALRRRLGLLGEDDDEGEAPDPLGKETSMEKVLWKLDIRRSEMAWFTSSIQGSIFNL